MQQSRPYPWRLLLIAWLVFMPAAAEPLYRWVDASGRVHFGDHPPATANARPVEVRVNTYHSTSLETLSAVFGAPQTNTVVMYSAAWCSVCTRAKAYFAAKRIAYQDFDVETSDKGRRDFRQLGGRGVPIILFAGQRMNGFSPAEFEGADRVGTRITTGPSHRTVLVLFTYGSSEQQVINPAAGLATSTTTTQTHAALASSPLCVRDARDTVAAAI